MDTLRYFADISDVSAIQKRLNSDGIVFFEYVKNIDDYLHYLSPFGQIYNHRDASSNGLTEIVHKSIRSIGNDGLSKNNLKLHTDRSCLEVPPKLMSTFFQAQSANGGDSLFLSSKVLYKELQKNYPEILSVLTTEVCIFFDESHSILSPVFFKNKDGWCIRYRDDEFINFGKETKKFKDILNSIMLDLSFTYKFNSGQGYILNNQKILHGRKSYIGERKVYRALINP